MNILTNNKLGVFISLFFFSLMPSTVVHGGTEVSQVLKKVVESHKQFTEGMSVSYQREILTKSMAMLDEDPGDKASGVFFFRGPDFLKMQQETPSKEYIISNGKNIWWYVPDEKTATRFDNVGKELSILSMIFMGLKNPEDDFDVTIAGPEDVKECVLTLSPKGPLEEEIDYISVTLSEKDYKITRVELLDLTGNLTRFKLGEFEQKKDLDDSFFDFKVPEGVKIIEEE